LKYIPNNALQLISPSNLKFLALPTYETWQ
jgi:hypothetical protein